MWGGLHLPNWRGIALDLVTGKHALVAGTASNLGGAIARALAHEGIGALLRWGGGRRHRPLQLDPTTDGVMRVACLRARATRFLDKTLSPHRGG